MFSILVPTDFSLCASNALKYALQLASLLEAEVTIFHAFETGDAGAKELRYRIEQETYDAAEFELSKLKELIAVSHPDLLCKTSIEIDYATNALYKMGNSGIYDLFIIGTHGSSRGGNPDATLALHYGSVTANLVGEVNTPILAVHEQDTFIAPKKFILLSDLQDMTSPDGYRFLNVLASRLNTSVNLVYIESKKMWVSDVFQEMNDIEKYFPDSPYEYNVIRANNIEKTVLDLPVNEYEMMVVVAKEKTIFQQMFGISLSKELSNYFTKPLLILPEFIVVSPSME